MIKMRWIMGDAADGEQSRNKEGEEKEERPFKFSIAAEKKYSDLQQTRRQKELAELLPYTF